MPAAVLIAAMDRAEAAGWLDPQVVLIDARRSATQVAPVVPIGALARYDRPTPTLTGLRRPTVRERNMNTTTVDAAAQASRGCGTGTAPADRPH